MDPEAIHSIARQLYLLATDANVRDHLRAAGLVQAGKFNWEKAARETLGVHQQAAALRARKRAR